ncbi:MAG: NAD(P)-dependent oxidoreductase [Desulfobacteraceae bacterium]|nr:NAD(P)-dependent oxidoreductase [Desulfobacteraceae bacterium]
MSLRLIGIGGMGLMLSPSARHLRTDGPTRFIRIHDRGTKDERREACRQAWRKHGAEIVYDYESLIGDGDFDGVVICAGKNGDDCDIFRAIVSLMNKNKKGNPFILQLSTVSAGFARAASEYLSSMGIEYANYPLTGGPAGADSASMLILASGSKSLYERLEPTLELIGKPKFFGTSVTAGAEVKLIGQLMVFNGLVGICSAAALKAACFGENLVGPEQSAFFDFLNGGAGGTRQWDVALSKGIRDDVWDQGFMLHHAVVDAIYAAELCRVEGLPSVAIIPMVATALSFAYLLINYEGTPLATHAIVREMIRENAEGIDAFLNKQIRYPDVDSSIKNSIAVLPDRVKDTVMLDIKKESFIVDA